MESSHDGSLADESWIWSGARPWWKSIPGIMVRDMDGRAERPAVLVLQRVRRLLVRPCPRIPAAVSEKVLIWRGDRRDASTNCTTASAARRSLCASAVVLSVLVLMSACAQSVHQSQRLAQQDFMLDPGYGRPKLCLLAWSRLWVWDWVWRVIGAIHSAPTVFPTEHMGQQGLGGIWRIRRIWCSVRRQVRRALVPCLRAMLLRNSRKILKELPRSSNDREPPKVPTASLVVTPIESVLYPFQYGLVSKVIRHRLPLHVDVRMLRLIRSHVRSPKRNGVSRQSGYW